MTDSATQSLGPAPKIIFITGAGRSGSTLLSRLLGAVPGVANLGEAAGYWTKRDMQARALPCSCGLPVERCPFWSNFAADVGASDPLLDGWLTLRGMASGTLRRSLTEGHLAWLASLYRISAERADTSVLVDASKHPAIGRMVTLLPDSEVHVVHLVRDPRAVASSRAAAKGYLRRIPAWRVAVNWTAANVAAEGLAPFATSFTRLRLDELVHEPRASLAKVTTGVGIPHADLSFMAGRRARIGLQHSLAGNPDKFGPANLEIEGRDWQVTAALALTVNMLTLPRLRRYGYSVGARSGST